MIQTHDYVILGAGITGLSVANLLSNQDYCIIEKENEAGGYCRSIYRDEFVWDYAGHFFHFRDKENQKFFEQAFQEGKIVKREKNTKILYRKKYIDYPFQSSISQLSKKEFIECLYDLYFAGEAHGQFHSFQEMLYAKFGKAIAEKFLIPYNEKLYACDLNALDANAMGRFFPYATLKDVMEHAKKGRFKTYNDDFIYPLKGARSVIDFLLAKIKSNALNLNTSVNGIDIQNKCIATTNGSIRYRYLISTIPLPQFLRLSGMDAPEKTLTYNKVLVLNLGFDKPAPQLPYHWIYVPDKSCNFYRVGFYNNIIGSEKLSLYIEIGFPQNASIDVEGEKRKAIHHLQRIGILSDHRLEAECTLIMDPAYVHISSESEKVKAALFPTLEKENVFFAGRYGQWTYCSMEDCVMQAKDVAEKLAKREA